MSRDERWSETFYEERRANARAVAPGERADNRSCRAASEKSSRRSSWGSPMARSLDEKAALGFPLGRFSTKSILI